MKFLDFSRVIAVQESSLKNSVFPDYANFVLFRYINRVKITRY